jgi:hypothetical protein
LKLPVELATGVGVLLGTVSALGYACGYLVLRARAGALGTDPAFKLVDQVYVFAGMRFLVATLIISLVLAPAILAVRWIALGLARALPDAVAGLLHWLTLIALWAMTLASMSILSVQGLLLRNDLPLSGLEAAVLGAPGGLRLALAFAPVLLAGLSCLWLYRRLASGSGSGALTLILALVVALQAFMLPIYHGALLADRRVRVLAAIPETVRGLVEPVAIVDRTADQATLLGSDGDGQRGLATVALGKLDGIPVRAVVPLEDFLDQLATPRPQPTHGSARARRVRVADASGASGGLVPANDGADPGKGFYASLTGYFGMILESVGSLGGPAGTFAGELWTVDLDASGQPSGRRRVGELSNISWPVAGADGDTYKALQGERVVRLDRDGAVVAVLAEGGGWRKLLGQEVDGSVLGLVRQDGETRPAEIASDGTVWVGPAPVTDEEKRALARLMQDARAYSGGETLTVDRSQRGGRGFDVFLRAAGTTHNLSDCGDDVCQQASLASDRRRALFVRMPRF